MTSYQVWFAVAIGMLSFQVARFVQWPDAEHATYVAISAFLLGAMSWLRWRP